MTCEQVIIFWLCLRQFNYPDSIQSRNATITEIVIFLCEKPVYLYEKVKRVKSWAMLCIDNIRKRKLLRI